MIKKILVLAVVIAFLPFSSNAQFNYSNSYFEAGIMGGVINYSGELTNTIMDFKHMHLGVAAFGRYNMNKYLSFRAQFAVGSISGDDADSKQLADQYRNLSFRSHLFEGSLNVEFNLMGFQPRGHEKMFSPYIFVGFAVFNYKPKGRSFDVTPGLEAQMIPLQPLNTEGQGDAFPERKPYPLTQFSIPLGAGIKFAINSHLNLGLEIGFRKTFTDYMDDVGNNYMYDPLADELLYDQFGGTPYKPGFFADKSMRELMADRTYEYLWRQAVESGETSQPFGVYFPTQEEYDLAVVQRGGKLQRGDKATDWYVFTALSISYNFIDNGLVRSRKRRKRKAGCKSSQF